MFARPQLVDLPFQFIVDVRDEVINKCSPAPVTGIEGRETIKAAYGRLSFVHRLEHFFPHIENGDEWNLLPQAIGSTDDGITRAMSLREFISTRRVNDYTGLIQFIMELDQAYRQLEGMYMSGSALYHTDFIQVSVARVASHDYSARSFMRGRQAARESCSIEVGSVFQYEKKLKLNLESKDYGFHCAINAILNLLEKKFVGFKVDVDDTDQWMSLSLADQWSNEKDGIGILNMHRLLSAFSEGGQFHLVETDLTRIIRVFYIQTENGFHSLSVSEVTNTLHVAPKRKFSPSQLSKTVEFGVVLFDNHWYCWQWTRGACMYNMLRMFLSKNACHRIPDKVPAVRMTFDIEPEERFEKLDFYYAQNETIYQDMAQLLRKKISFVILGPAGSGKSYMLKRFLEEFNNSVVLSRDAFVTSQVYKTGHTLHFAFQSFKKDKTCKLDKKLEYIFIDEISNMQSDWVTKIDDCLRKTYNAALPFGGITIVWCGDFMQLLPINPLVNSGKRKCLKDRMMEKLFLHPTISKMCARGFVFNLDAPIRFFLEGDSEENKKYAYAMKCLRFGQIIPWLLNVMPARRINNFSKFMKENTDAQYVCVSNKQCRKVYDLYLQHYCSPDNFVTSGLYWESKECEGGSLTNIPSSICTSKDFVAVVGEKYIITSNLVRTNLQDREFCPSVCNGSVVVLISVNEKCLEVSMNEEEFLLFPFCRRTKSHYSYCYPIKPMVARTVHGVQAMTYDKIVLVLDGKTSFQKHQLYVAMSRSKTIGGFYYFCEGRRSIDLSSHVRVDPLNCVFSKNPSKVIYPAVKIEDVQVALDRSFDRLSQYYMWNSDDRGEIYNYKVRNKRMGTNGIKDFCFSENDKYTRNTLIFDIETLVLPNDKLFAFIIGFKYYYRGRPCDPSKVFPVEKKWEYDASTGNCLIRWDIDINPQLEFSKLIISLSFALSRLIECTTRPCLKSDLYADLPLYVCGYNINGFDLYGVYEELIKSKDITTKYRLDIIKTNGSSTKGFSASMEFDEKRRRVMTTHDIREILNTGSLKDQLRDWVQPVLDLKDRAKSLEGYLTMQEYLCKDYQSEYMTDISVRLGFQARSDYRPASNAPHKFKKKLTSRVRTYIDQFSGVKKNAERLERFRTEGAKKGCPPLKLLNHYNTLELFLSIPDKVNIWNEMDKGKDWERCFYEREVNEAKQFFSQEDLENYALMKEMKNYVFSDVDFTDLLYRVANNIVYNFGEDYFIQDGRNGLRCSILSFRTACQLTGLLSALYLPSDVRDKDISREISIHQPLYDGRTYELIRRTPGGKVLPRDFYYRSEDWESEYKVYLDISGMYQSVMKKCSYPYGGFTIIQDQAALDGIRDALNSGEDVPRCCILVCTRSMHPKELDPPAGVKMPATYDASEVFFTKNDFLKYTNAPVPSVETNVSCIDIVRSGGEIYNVHYAILWSNQDVLYKNYMDILLKGKEEAQRNGEKAKRSFYKLLANAEYGNMGKQNYASFSILVDADDANEMEEILNRGDFKVTFERIQNDKYLYNYECLDFGISDRPTHVSAFVLSYSKRLMNRAIEVVFGEDRHTDKSFDLCPLYGDTDSVVVSREGVQRLVQNDKGLSIEDQMLFYQTTPEEHKLGKFTDEIADGEKGYDPSFPNLETGFCGRVVEMVCPQPKCYAVMYIVPPKTWLDGRPCTSDCFPSPYDLDWTVKYKFCAKGVPKGANIEPLFEDESSDMQKQIWKESVLPFVQVEAAGNNKYTFSVMKFCHLYDVPLVSRKENITRFMEAAPSSELQFSMKKTKMERKLFTKRWTGRDETNGKRFSKGYQRVPYNAIQISNAEDKARILVSQYCATRY